MKYKQIICCIFGKTNTGNIQTRKPMLQEEVEATVQDFLKKESVKEIKFLQMTDIEFGRGEKYPVIHIFYE